MKGRYKILWLLVFCLMHIIIVLMKGSDYVTIAIIINFALITVLIRFGDGK